MSVFRAVECVKVIKNIKNQRADADADELTLPYICGFSEANGVMAGASLPVIAKPLWRMVKQNWPTMRWRLASLMGRGIPEDGTSTYIPDSESVMVDTTKTKTLSVTDATMVRD